jgi:hypothetical protein
MEPIVRQSSALYFAQHKASKRRAALFRQLRSAASKPRLDVRQQLTFRDLLIAQRLHQDNGRWTGAGESRNSAYRLSLADVAEHRKGVLIPAKRTEMKYEIKSFIIGVKEARGILCTTVYGRPARRAYDMGRKLSDGFLGLLKLRMG